MKPYQIILIIVLVAVGFYLANNYFNKTEHMADIPDEINKLLEESNEETYYSEETNTGEDDPSSEENRSEEELVNSATSVDSDTLPPDSATSVTGVDPEQNRGPKPSSEELVLGESIIGSPVGAFDHVGEVEERLGVEPERPRLRHHHDHVFPGMEKKQCTVGKTSDDADEYIRKLVLEGQQYCSNNRCADESVIKNYREDFFNFRDKVWDNSRKNDLSYKVARLYLEGNTKLTDRVKGRKVADIYDELTRAQPIRDKNCIKKTDFDDTLHHGYYNTQGVGERHFSRDNWMYMNDIKPVNKVIDSGLLGYDPVGNLQSLVEVGQQYQTSKKQQ